MSLTAKPASKETSTKAAMPSLQTSAKRLERLLTTTTSKPTSTTSSSSILVEATTTLIHSNPCKIVKRWLGTSSEVASQATLSDISMAAFTLLNPMGNSATGRDLLLQLAKPVESMQIDTSSSEINSSSSYLIHCEKEVETWLLSLAIRLLWKESRYEDAMTLVTKSIQIIMTHLNESSTTSNPNTTTTSSSSLYPIIARLYRYQSLIAESIKVGGVVVVDKSELSHAHRMAVLRRDVDTQATLLNLMLRNLLNTDQVEQAQKLLSNSTFPDSASNNQLCRYLYYSGRIQALRLEYTSAFANLSQCLRKAPTNTGLGFRIAAQRLLIVVQLLMGEIPERSVFFSTSMVGELLPYLKITQAVRRGDLAVFHETVQVFRERLDEDGTYTLISRLAHSVVKAGLRRLNTSYSRISLQDIAHRLGLGSATSAEFVVAKAIRDGVIDATIHHDEGYVQSHDLVDVYATTEPMEAFHRRIAYCLTTHNDAVRGMRYAPDAYKKQLEAGRGSRGRKEDDKTDEEKAQEIEDELDDDY